MRLLSFVLASALCLTVVVAATNYQFNIAVTSCTAGGDPLSGTGCPTGNTQTVSYLISDATGNQGIAPSGTAASVFPVPLTLSVGDTIYFTLTASTASHPFVICKGSTDAQTCGGTAAGSANIVSGIPLTTAGQTANYTVQASDVATGLWYGCRIHSGMGSKITVVNTGASETICTYFTRLTQGGSSNAKNQLDFIALVVNRAVFGNGTGIYTNPAVPGILGTGSPIAQFFTAGTGTTPFCNRAGVATVCTFPNPSPEFTALATHLYAFFGNALGCNALGYPQFTREVSCNAASNANGCSMAAVHKFMNINQAQFDYFNTQVVKSVLSYTNNGVLLRTGDAATLTGFLNGFGRGADNRASGGIISNTQVAAGASQQICIAADCTESPYTTGAGFILQPTFTVFALVVTLAVILISTRE